MPTLTTTERPSERRVQLRRRSRSACAFLALITLALGSGAIRALDTDASLGLEGPAVARTQGAVAGAQPEEDAFAPLLAQVGGAMNAAFSHAGTLWLGVGPRLVALDADDPAAPRRLGLSPLLPGVVQDAALDEARGWAWLATGEALVAIDLARPEAPAVAARTALPGPATRVALAAGEPWVLLADGRLLGFRAQADGTLTEGARFEAPAGYEAGDVAGSEEAVFRLELATRDTEAPDRLFAASLADPGGPVTLPVVALETSGGSSWGTQLEWHEGRLWTRMGNVIYVHRAPGGSAVLDAMDLLAPGGFAVAMTLIGQRAYASFTSGYGANYEVFGFDVSDPSEIAILPSRGASDGSHPGLFQRAIAVHGGAVWASSGGGALTAHDTSDGALLAPLGRFDTVGSLEDLARDGPTLHALADQAAQSIDVSAPALPRPIARLASGARYAGVTSHEGVTGIAIAGVSDRLFSSLQVFDTRDPARPLLRFEGDGPVKERGFPCSSPALASMRDRMVWAGCDAGASAVVLLDASATSADDAKLDELWLDGYPRAVDLQEERLLIAVSSDENELSLMRARVAGDALQEGDQIFIANERAARSPKWLVSSNDFAYLLAQETYAEPPDGSNTRRLGIFSIDLRDPNRLLLADVQTLACDDLCAPTGLLLGDGHLFLASQRPAGLRIYALDDPSHPRLAQTYATRSGLSGLALGESVLYAAAGAGGLEVYARPAGGWSAPPDGVPPATSTASATATPPAGTATPTSSATPPGEGGEVILPWLRTGD